MEFEDSRNALFVEPNAYIQNYSLNKREQVNKPKKIIFQEPYDCLPNYYINNGFKKGGGSAELKSKPILKEETKVEKSTNPFSFDFKSLMPMLGMLGSNSATGIGSLLSSFGGGEKGLDFSKIIGSLLQNKDSLSSILNLLTGKKKETKNHSKEDLKSTDFEIKNYTKV